MQKVLVRSGELAQALTRKGLKVQAEVHGYHAPPSIDLLQRISSKRTEDKTAEDCFMILKALDTFSSFHEHWSGLECQEALFYALSAKLKLFEPFDALCRVGEQPTEIYYLLNGQIAVTNISNAIFNQEVLEGKIFHLEGGGATLGEMSILYNSTR